MRTMANSNGKLQEHKLITDSTVKFDILFGDIQKQKKNITATSLEEIFFFEIQLINSYFQQTNR